MNIIPDDRIGCLDFFAPPQTVPLKRAFHAPYLELDTGVGKGIWAPLISGMRYIQSLTLQTNTPCVQRPVYGQKVSAKRSGRFGGDNLCMIT